MNKELVEDIKLSRVCFQNALEFAKEEDWKSAYDAMYEVSAILSAVLEEILDRLADQLEEVGIHENDN